jgi:hypothetical protein
MLRSPVRSFISAALTPSNDGCPSVNTAPWVGGISPAIAFSSVLLPEPLRPIRPTDSPWYDVNETPRIACTSRSTGEACLRSIRCRAAAAVPLPPEPAPNTR